MPQRRQALSQILAALIVPADDSSGSMQHTWGSGFDCESGGAAQCLSSEELAWEIQGFLAHSHAIALYSPCCEVSATVLLLRLHGCDSFAITGANWRAMIFVALLISQKLVDDIALPNDEFVTLWSMLLNQRDAAHAIAPLTLPKLNQMERQLCALLQWDVSVSSDVFWAAIGGIENVVEEIRADEEEEVNDDAAARTAPATATDDHAADTVATPAATAAAAAAPAPAAVAAAAADVAPANETTSDAPVAGDGNDYGAGEELPKIEVRLANETSRRRRAERFRDGIGYENGEGCEGCEGGEDGDGGKSGTGGEGKSRASRNRVSGAGGGASWLNPSPPPKQARPRPSPSMPPPAAHSRRPARSEPKPRAACSPVRARCFTTPSGSLVADARSAAASCSAAGAPREQQPSSSGAAGPSTLPAQPARPPVGPQPPTDASGTTRLTSTHTTTTAATADPQWRCPPSVQSEPAAAGAGAPAGDATAGSAPAGAATRVTTGTPGPLRRTKDQAAAAGAAAAGGVGGSGPTPPALWGGAGAHFWLRRPRKAAAADKATARKAAPALPPSASPRGGGGPSPRTSACASPAPTPTAAGAESPHRRCGSPAFFCRNRSPAPPLLASSRPASRTSPIDGAVKGASGRAALIGHLALNDVIDGVLLPTACGLRSPSPDHMACLQM